MRPKNGTKPPSRSGNVRQAICERYSTPRLTDRRAAALCIDRPHRPAVSHTQGSGVRLAQHNQEPMANILLSTQANSPQHEYKNRAVFLMHQRKASRNALFLQAIS